MIYLLMDPWTWDGSEEVVNPDGGPGSPSTWDLFSLLSDFMCAQNPYGTIVTKTVLEFNTQTHKTLEFFALMQRSPATAEGTFWPILEP